MIKKILKLFLPKFLIEHLKAIRDKFELNKYKNLSNQEVFKKIYEEKIWTPESEKGEFKYYSGLGSHKEDFTENYIEKVSLFLKSLKKKPSVVELGCGDFVVSSRLVSFTDKYTACDIFEDLINQNKKKYFFPNVFFKVIDITKDELPSGDICIVRCVLQHLSNEMITNFLKKIENKYTYLLITEHYPKKKEFKPNLNIITGPNIRLHLNSAVDLTKEPFNLRFIEETNLCNVYSKLIVGYLKTQLYKLK